MDITVLDNEWRKITEMTFCIIGNPDMYLCTEHGKLAWIDEWTIKRKEHFHFEPNEHTCMEKLNRTKLHPHARLVEWEGHSVEIRIWAKGSCTVNGYVTVNNPINGKLIALTPHQTPEDTFNEAIEALNADCHDCHIHPSRQANHSENIHMANYGSCKLKPMYDDEDEHCAMLEELIEMYSKYKDSLPANDMLRIGSMINEAARRHDSFFY